VTKYHIQIVATLVLSSFEDHTTRLFRQTHSRKWTTCVEKCLKIANNTILAVLGELFPII